MIFVDFRIGIGYAIRIENENLKRWVCGYNK